MKYIEEFRDRKLAEHLCAAIASAVDPARRYSLMEFCGGHTHVIYRYGLDEFFPKNIRMVHGPGCPVCVLPIGRLENALDLARLPDAILCTYGDMMRVPDSSGESLLSIKAEGADVRMIFSAADALRIARENPGKEVIFFAVGFETTTPPTALAILSAFGNQIENFSVFCNHVLTPPAIMTILESPEVRDMGTVRIDGFIGPSHVSTVIGTQPYEFFAEEYRRPVVIAGFEPLDVLQAVLMLVRQINRGEATVENEFSRAVCREGNVKAKGMVAEVFELRKEFEWRGLGLVPYSALRIKKKYEFFDAEKRFGVPGHSVADRKGCECGAVLRGMKDPKDCRLFGAACTPETPYGSCMVSAEGACAAYYSYGRFRSRPASAGVGDAGTWGRGAADPETPALGARPTPEAETLTRPASETPALGASETLTRQGV